jgi:hypothetical protein
MALAVTRRKRRRLIEACLAVMVLGGVSAALLGQGHHPAVLSGGLLGRDTPSR